MPDIHFEILNPAQLKLLPLITSFGDDFFLVGGTALALQYGHRQSLDFDLFSASPFNNNQILKKIRRAFPIENIFIEGQGELTLQTHGIRFTVYHYPFPIDHQVVVQDKLTMPPPLTIAAMKAYALGRRAKWKDYLDLYFVFQHHPLSQVVTKAQSIFRGEFEEKLFREQLAYHKDINYADTVGFMPGYEVSQSEVLASLTNTSLL